VEPSVVYLDFQAMGPPSGDDLDRIAAILDSTGADPCVWAGQTPGLVRVCVDIAEPDLWLAAQAAARELTTAMVGAGVPGELRKVTACNEREQLIVDGGDLRRLHHRGGQTYCDWCSAPLTATSITESECLGLGRESTWACSSCLARDAHRTAPNGSDPDTPWPFTTSK
jgi:hypothetical protein